jgi:pyrroline-5-carboxylate reductase
MAAVLAEVAPTLSHRQLVISIAAGVATATIR